MEAVQLVRSLLLTAALLTASSCAFSRFKPCTDGGEPALTKPTGGTRQCVTQLGPNGKEQNHGGYREWHPNGKLAVEGEYYEGKKNGRWTEWDAEGKKLGERFFRFGKEVPRFDTPAQNLLTGQKLPQKVEPTPNQ